MALAGAITGMGGVLAYFGAAFAPLPDGLTLVLAFAFGPLFGLSFLGLFHALRDERDGAALRFGVILGLVAGATVTIMLVVQLGNNMMLQEQLARAETEAAREAARLVHRAVNDVQLLIDVAWDVFGCGAGALIGLAMVGHRRFGRVWGGTGILASVALLYFNLETFPRPPAEAGSVDLGPLLAIWFVAVYVRVTWLSRRSARASA